MSDFSNALRDHRTSLFFTQAEYAKHVGVSPAAIAAWETDARVPSLAMARKLVAHGVNREIVLDAVMRVQDADNGAAA